jgi:peptidyl-prolyl cis-trans isomerase B (cyclophilin B)
VDRNGEITYLYNVSAQMKVDGNVRICFAIAVTMLATTVVYTSAAPLGSEIPGYRRLVEAESSRTFSSELVTELGSRNPALASRAALALGRTKDVRASAPLLARFRESHDTGVRAMSLYALGLLADKTPIDIGTVLRALHDHEGAVRVAAVDAAQRIIAAKQPGADVLDAPLTSLMQSDRDPIVRGRAAVTLASFADAPAETAAARNDRIGATVIAAYENEKNATVRWHEAWALGRAFPKAPSVTQIQTALADKDQLIRMEFLLVAGRHGGPEMARIIEPLTHDPEWRVAEQASESIVRINTGARSDHLTKVPDGVTTPAPLPEDTTAPLPRPNGLGAMRKPLPSDAILTLPLHPTTSAALDGPVAGLHPRVRIGTTQGAIVVRLYPEWAPLTVANFLNAVNRGYYDNLRWFRVVPNFVAQTGDAKNGAADSAGPGYTIPAEENPLEQRPGIISMGLEYDKSQARRDSAGTEFYITMSPQMHLNRPFTVFGEVESGFNVLGRLIESDTMTRVEELPPD